MRALAVAGAWIGGVGLGAQASAADAWSPVPPMDWSRVTPADFDDAELEIPYYLNHFARVANRVVEQGEHRGFLDLAVNREPKDNKPYNARILENNLALAYFYATDRPWNPYRGSPAVRVRLEAMLDFWCRSQHPETGLFAEYAPDNFSLAPTGFGIMHVAHTLDLLKAEGAPPIDADVLKRTMLAQRRGILALLTGENAFKWGKGYSNQWSGVLRAATSYLLLDPADAQVRAALMPAVERAHREFQSPTGFLYEAYGPDVGYSTVHENNLLRAWGQLAKFPNVTRAVLAEGERWDRFLSYHLVLQPGTVDYFANSAVNTRTAAAVQQPRERPWTQTLESGRFLARTREEDRDAKATARRALESTWPTFKDLAVPSAFSYQTAAYFSARPDHRPWFPSDAERRASIDALPYLARSQFTTLAHDGRRNLTFAHVRRPGYYAIFNAGKRADRQNFGLGLLWHPTAGVVWQAVAGTAWVAGTDAAPDDAKREVREQKDVLATLAIGTAKITPKDGYQELPPNAPLTASYDEKAGEKSVAKSAATKSVRFENEAVVIEVARPGEFAEWLPLVTKPGDRLEASNDRVTLTRGDVTFAVTFGTGVKAVIEADAAAAEKPKYERVMVKLTANDRLTYRLTFTGR